MPTQITQVEGGVPWRPGVIRESPQRIPQEKQRGCELLKREIFYMDLSALGIFL